MVSVCSKDRNKFNFILLWCCTCCNYCSLSGVSIYGFCLF